MFNTLLFIHLVLSLLLIIVILLQKTSSDGLSGIGGGGNNMGLVSGRAAANFLTKTTIFLAVVFFINALVLANISSNNHGNITKKLEKQEIHNSLNQKNIELDQIPANIEIDTNRTSEDDAIKSSVNNNSEEENLEATKINVTD